MAKIEGKYEIRTNNCGEKIFREKNWGDGQHAVHVIGEGDILLEGNFTTEELRYFIEVMEGKHGES